MTGIIVGAGGLRVCLRLRAQGLRHRVGGSPKLNGRAYRTSLPASRATPMWALFLCRPRIRFMAHSNQNEICLIEYRLYLC